MQANNKIVAHHPVLFFLLTLLLAGCGGGGGGSSSPTPPAVPQSVSVTTPSGLTATLAEDRSAILVNGTVTYTLTLTNSTDQPITFQPQVGNTFGYLIVTNAAGGVVYPAPPSGATPALSVGPGANVTLAPTQSSSQTIAVAGVFSTSGTYAANMTFVLGPTSPATTQTPTVGPLNVTVQ